MKVIVPPPSPLPPKGWNNLCKCPGKVSIRYWMPYPHLLAAKRIEIVAVVEHVMVVQVVVIPPVAMKSFCYSLLWHITLKVYQVLKIQCSRRKFADKLALRTWNPSTGLIFFSFNGISTILLSIVIDILFFKICVLRTWKVKETGVRERMEVTKSAALFTVLCYRDVYTGNLVALMPGCTLIQRVCENRCPRCFSVLAAQIASLRGSFHSLVFPESI